MRGTLRIGLALVAITALAACDESEPRCSGPDLGLDGTWFGAMEDEGGVLYTLEWRICGDTIAREAIGGISVGATGSLRPAGTGVWRGALSDGTQFRMLTDPTRLHAMVVNDYFEFAVLERDSLGLPEFYFSDLDGHWRGRHARISWAATDVQQAWALCGAGSCTTTEAGGTSATLSFSELDPDFGMYRGSFVDSWGDEGIAGALMSGDLLFMGTYTCPYDYLGPEDCTFGALRFD